MIGLLVLPHSNADAEHIFSQINLIKSKTRNKLHTQTVSSLLTTKDDIPDCRQFNPDNQMIKSMDSSTIYGQLNDVELETDD